MMTVRAATLDDLDAVMALRRHYPRKDGALWDAVIMGLLLEEEGQRPQA